jgi:hypothetical protein
MKVGDKVKVDKIGGFYPTYKEWAEIVGAKRWTNNKYPESMEFVVEAIGNHLTESITLYLLSNDEGEFIFDNIHSNIATVKRTRTEYEKVTESIFGLRDEFERGELYTKKFNQEWHQIKTEEQLGNLLSMNDDPTKNGIYRKVEREIDWRVDADSYFLKTKYLWINCTIEEAITRSDYCDEFLELCRVALRANGEIE